MRRMKLNYDVVFLNIRDCFTHKYLPVAPFGVIACIKCMPYWISAALTIYKLYSVVEKCVNHSSLSESEIKQKKGLVLRELRVKFQEHTFI
jgi:hypothetical protein